MYKFKPNPCHLHNFHLQSCVSVEGTPSPHFQTSVLLGASKLQGANIDINATHSSSLHTSTSDIPPKSRLRHVVK